MIYDNWKTTEPEGYYDHCMGCFCHECKRDDEILAYEEAIDAEFDELMMGMKDDGLPSEEEIEDMYRFHSEAEAQREVPGW